MQAASSPLQSTALFPENQANSRQPNDSTIRQCAGERTIAMAKSGTSVKPRPTVQGFRNPPPWPPEPARNCGVS